MTNVIPFPRTAAGISATRIPRAEFERLAELALDVVDRIILLLDEADGDAEAEDGGDCEPSLGAPEGHASQIIWLRGGDDDREHDTAPIATWSE
ncbi:hypothetical protein DK419_15570 [Methylobacterium terrae]|uniref:Uncharacterized protein n=1 Tax=Methylobacterium terrae TaxID=2202827 RepID=A0A2U8WPY0_9HYPH|nr:hypothetical protein [Methylobacterium terrae]AWN47551.1 hypothetical protein DK419_15570 [Methylobacterium terrae]